MENWTKHNISRFEKLDLPLSTMRTMQGTLLKTIEEAEAKMVSNKNRMQRIGGKRPLYYLSEDKKEQLLKLVDDNQDKQPKNFVPAIAKEMDLPEKTVYNLVDRSRARSVKKIVNNDKD